MRVADQHSVEYNTTPQVGLTARISPEFANSLRTALESDSGSEPGFPAEAGGLLFGTTGEGVIALRAFRSFTVWKQHGPDSEIAASELIGWCYLRRDGSKGLLQRDVQFHNRHFPRATDLMLILNPEREHGLSIELFARGPVAPFSTEDFYSGSFHVCAGSASLSTLFNKLLVGVGLCRF